MLMLDRRMLLRAGSAAVGAAALAPTAPAGWWSMSPQRNALVVSPPAAAPRADGGASFGAPPVRAAHRPLAKHRLLTQPNQKCAPPQVGRIRAGPAAGAPP